MQATIARVTVIKQSTVPARKLSSGHKAKIPAGIYKIEKSAPACNGHVKVTFEEPIASMDKSQMFSTWCVYDDDIRLPNEKDSDCPSKIILDTPYYYQGDNHPSGQGTPWRHCNSNCAAMLLEQQIPGSLTDPATDRGWQPEEYYMTLLDGDTTDHGAHTRTLRRLGLKTRWFTNLDYEDVIESIREGFPVMLGTLLTHAGHIVLAIGFDEDGLYIHDPAGEFPYRKGYGPHGNGKHHSWNLLDRMWLVEGDSSGWGRLKV